MSSSGGGGVAEEVARLWGELPVRVVWAAVAAQWAAAAAAARAAVVVPAVRALVAVSLAMTVYKLSIGAACSLDWPSDRVVIQVLDDSTDLVVKFLTSVAAGNSLSLSLLFARFYPLSLLVSPCATLALAGC
ncbi:Os08g0434500 [Oryza sativa Japonica Group]|uniref:Os08g0434500 protein n=1 Tax=Oryza sativa subsp. japonica TaxID=39947 RepID=A0A0P0XGC5_ORYSJ|nr:Os08g0434500 [Oryza sativa Japonica Group]